MSQFEINQLKMLAEQFDAHVGMMEHHLEDEKFARQLKGGADDSDPAMLFVRVFETEIVELRARVTQLQQTAKALAPSSVSAQAVTGWQPISSAPKDGTWFLAWDYDGGCYVFRDGPGYIASEEPQPTHWMPLPSAPEPAGRTQEPSAS